ncbi:hypothetical protein LCGC14_1365930 [marine sediment metagenome]|uniref:NYN domain-containing protein n=1 Tax=marine sediment metagenome TaxID=412755 RepID=A0A0F9N8U9_9ZZZZ
MDEVAIFWDYENVRVVAKGINVPLAEALIKYSESQGHPRVKKVYSNWAGINKEIVQALYSLGFDTIHISMGKTNSADVKIAVDCLETAKLYPDINSFIIVTGDKDFIPVVNSLKADRRKVIIVGNSNIVSEHLLLSADDFISLEELSKMYKSRNFSKSTKPKKKEKAISFNKAVKWLKDTVKLARLQSKTTRLALIDNFMRSSQNFDYKGSSVVQQPNDKSSTFSSFTKFITEAEKQGKIKTEIIEGFMEIFLIEENPQVESELNPNLKDVIEKEDWRLIFETLIKAYTDIKSEEKVEHKYAYLHNQLRTLKKEGLLLYSNSKLSSAITKLEEIGFLNSKDDSKYTLTEDYKENLENYIEKATV